MSDSGENWNRAYVEAPEIFDAFSRAEDPDGLITRSVLKHAALDGRRVLEIGCGTGRYTREWAPCAASYLALEKSPGMLQLARRHCAGPTLGPDFICANAAAIPVRDDTVDRVLAGWVVINLPPRLRTMALRETARVLGRGPGAGLWLIENHWSGEFQLLRGRRRDDESARVRALIDRHGFSIVEVVHTEMRFPSTEEAERILGRLCGEAVRRRLHENPVDRLTHHVVILHRPARSFVS